MESLIISDFKTGYETDVEPFKLNNDAFPILHNARLWRSRIRKKQGSAALGRLQRDFTNESISTTDGSGNYLDNIKTLLSLETNSEIIPGSVTITVTGGTTEVFTSVATNGVLTGDQMGMGSINYVTGAVTLDTDPDILNAPVTIAFSYYPCLPVLGLELFVQDVNFPDTIHFDQKYSYRIDQGTSTYFDVSFYKASQNRLVWSGENYEQFWGESYRNALWVTNNKAGFHKKDIAAITTGMTTSINILGHGLITNDWIFINEVTGMDDTDGDTGINGMTFQVTFVDIDNFTIVLNSSGLTAPTNPSGIIQLLTTSLSNSVDGIRWYDGDPTGAAPPSNNGWVNFAPPLQNTGLSGGSPDYLVGAKAIVAFKDRLLFFGVWLQKSSGGVSHFPNRMVYSQNGTPYYYDDVTLTPLNQGGESEAWYTNVPARGGFLGAPVQQEFINASEDGDVLITQFTDSQRRLIFSGDDSFPFYYQTIDSELGTLHTFSGIALDKGVLSIGDRGIILTTQNSCDRVDDKIPDEVFDAISRFNNDEKRLTAIRDYRNEYVYWTFTPQDQINDQNASFFPARTLIFNYKDLSWSTQDDHYTHYGYFSKNNTYTWATIPFDTWAEWTNPWNFGGAGERFPLIIGGNQQGFVRVLDLTSASESSSHRYTAVTGNTFTSPNHDIVDGDYVIIESGIGITVGTTLIPLPSTARLVISVADENTFEVDGTAFAGTLLGGGTIRKVNNYDIRTKEFPNFWGGGLGIEISEQKYLFGDVPGGVTNAFIYTGISKTAVNDPETNNYTPVTPTMNMFANNLFFKSVSENTVWKQGSGSFAGNTVQIQFRLSDEQMRNENYNEKDFTLHAIVINISPGAEL